MKGYRPDKSAAEADTIDAVRAFVRALIAWRTLRDFAKQPRYQDAMKPLVAWRRLIEASDFAGPHELRRRFRE